MIYRFTIISDEEEDFLREIQIDSEATFYDFHKAILKSVGYKDDQMTSFFICDDNWEKEKEVTLEEMDTSSDVDTWVMDETKLDELLEDEKQKLAYVFDPLSERMFFIELSEMITGKDLPEPVCSKKKGKAPKQVLDFDELGKMEKSESEDLGENFYGDEDFNEDDFDEEGFSVGEGNPYDDER